MQKVHLCLHQTLYADCGLGSEVKCPCISSQSFPLDDVGGGVYRINQTVGCTPYIYLTDVVILVHLSSTTFSSLTRPRGAWLSAILSEIIGW